jgi:hypothetical protein
MVGHIQYLKKSPSTPKDTWTNPTPPGRAMTAVTAAAARHRPRKDIKHARRTTAILGGLETIFDNMWADFDEVFVEA